jgi:hypothetical protein
MIKADFPSFDQCSPGGDLIAPETILFLMVQRGMRLIRAYPTADFKLCTSGSEAVFQLFQVSPSAVRRMQAQGYLARVEAEDRDDLFCLTAEGWRAGRRGDSFPKRVSPSMSR